MKTQRSRAAALALLLLLLLLTACGEQGGTALSVWRVCSRGSQTCGETLRAEAVLLPPDAAPIPAAVAAFSEAPHGDGLENPLPAHAALIGGTLEDGTLTLRARPGYAGLAGAQRTQANACIVLTFTALEGVARVTLQSGGRTIFEEMTADDFALRDVSAENE